MTYCIGWKNRSGVFIVADSAATGAVVPSTEQSSVGERHERQLRGFVQESLLKLIKLSDAVIGAYSGSVTMADDVMEVLQERLKIESPEDALRTAVTSCGPYATDNQIGLMMGFMKNDEPQLLSFNHDGRQQIVNHESIVDMGSMSATAHAEISRIIAHKIANGNLPNDRALEISASILQSFTIHDSLMRIGVGGVFFGVRVDNAGIQWQSDTSYVFYNASPTGIKNPDFITVIERDCAVVVSSSITNDTRVFFSTRNTSNPGEWIQKWKTFLKGFFDSGDSRFYVFLNKDSRLITVAKVDSDLRNRYFHVIAAEGGHFDLAISPEFHARLNAVVETPEATEQVSIGFRLSFLDVHNPVP